MPASCGWPGSGMTWRWPRARDRGDQMIAVDALDRRFAGRIDLGDDHGVGVVEAGRERLEQRLQARVAVRLHHGDDLALGRFARGLEHRGDLDRMVAVVVDDGDAVPCRRRG